MYVETNERKGYHLKKKHTHTQAKKKT